MLETDSPTREAHNMENSVLSDRRKRVLIVDDEEDLTWTLSKKLSKDSDKFDLYCMNSGREAIEMLNQMPFDLVITDVRMPEVSGLDLLVEIKDLYPETKVAIMTAYGSSDVQHEATNRGCFSYIEKPFEINELRQLILDALREKKGFKGSVSDFQLSDIIQLNCLGRLTSALKLHCDGEDGLICFQDGNIVHSETRHLEGESAFYHIMSWQAGEFQVLRNFTPRRETITKGWQSLLLESLRRVDENSDMAKREAEREKRRRLRQVQQLLSRIHRAEGVEHVLIHTRVGFPLFYYGGYSERRDVVNELGNHVSTLLDSIVKVSTFMKGGELEFWEFQFEKRIYIFQHIPGEDAYLSVIGKDSVNSGFVRVEIKKNLQTLRELI